MQIEAKSLKSILMAASLFVSLSSSAKSPVEFCPPYSEMEQLAVDVSKPFLQYSIRVENGADGRRQVFVVGDDVQLDASTFGALVRTAVAADSKIARISIDARRIRVVDSLAVVNASVELSAKEIYFVDGSAISVLPGPNSKIRLSAKDIHLSPEGFRHFDVRARQFPDNRIDDYGDVGNILETRSERILVNGTSIQPAALKAFLSKRFSRYPLTDFSAKIDAQTGDEGHSAWVKSTKQSSEWPQYSIAVLRSAFLVAPFNKKVRSDIVAEVDRNLEVLEQVASGNVVFDARMLRQAASSGIDLKGNGPAFAPSRPLSKMLDEVAAYSAGGSKLQSIDFYIAALTEASAGAPIPQATLSRQASAFSEEVRSATIAYQNTNNELSKIQTSIGSIVALLATQRAAYAEREKRLKDHVADVEQGKRKRAEGVAALATVASIATTAYTGNPEMGSRVGGVIYAVGNATAGKPVIDSLSAGYQFATAVEKPLASVNKTIAGLKESRATYGKFIDSFTLENITIRSEIPIQVAGEKPDDPPKPGKLTRDQALRDLGDQATKLKGGVDDLLKVYEAFAPSPSPVTAAIEEDQSLQAIAAEIAISLEQVKQISLKLEALQRTVQEQSVALVATTERLARLTDVSLTNEGRRRMLGSLALEGARDELASFTSLLDLIRRVSLLEFRAPLPVDPTQIQNAYVMEAIGKSFNPAATLDERAVGDQYIELLKSRRLHVVLLAGAVVRASQAQFVEFVETQGRAPYISYPTEEFVSYAGSPAVERKFLAQLNDLLRAQFQARNDVTELKKLYETQLEIPFYLRSKIDERYPARLLNVALTAVEPLGGMSGGDLVFRVEVERIGNSRKASRSIDIGKASSSKEKNAAQDSECFSIDLRSKNTPYENYVIPYEFTIGQIKGGKVLRRTQAQSFWYLQTADAPPSLGRTMMVTYPPAEARMYLKVRLDANVAWKKAPEIGKLTLTAEIFQ